MSEDDSEPENRIPSVVEQVRREVGDTWRQDPQLLDKFFSIRPDLDACYKNARKKHYNERSKRWKRVATTPKPLSRLYVPLVDLMNSILIYYGISPGKRMFFNTHARRPGPSTVEPGIFLAGIGDEFANTVEPRPYPIAHLGISAFEVSLDSDDPMEARDRLAVHIHRVFQHQANRRFAFGLVITQQKLTVYMFDHSGAVASEPCDYHAHPDRFCAIISRLASEKDEIGFDTSIFGDGPIAKIRTHEPGDGDSVTVTDYIIEEGLFRFPSLVGRGTMCWLTVGRDDRTFVVKDAWIAPSELAGRESEASLLRHAQNQGVISGVAQIHHFEEVRRSADASDLDTILRNRWVESSSPDDMKVERIHTRIVMATHGKTLDKFSTRMELLLAFYDAVLAHRQLHDVAGILHRDISVRNILINPDGLEGDRGILIDFDHSIRVGDTSPYSTKTKIGTWRYMSRDVLRERGHTYLDDLESFYYVLCWILGSFERAGVPKIEPAPDIPSWDKPDSDQLKGGHIATAFTLPISPWFGDSLWDLAADLHDFFQSRLIHPPSAIDPVKDYDEFISYICQGIAELEKEELEKKELEKEEPGQKEPEKAAEPEAANVQVSAPRVSDIADSVPGKRNRVDLDEAEPEAQSSSPRVRRSPKSSSRPALPRPPSNQGKLK